MRLTTAPFAAALLGFLSACSSLTLRPTDFSWPVESVLKPDASGTVEDERYNITFNVKPLYFEETADSTAFSRSQVRMIRDKSGYYFVTAQHFKNVYVFASDDGALVLQNKIQVSETGLASPAFNQRSPFVQLINGKEAPKSLSKNGVQEGGKK